MNAKPTRMLFAAVALSVLAAVLASSAYARIPEGNRTVPSSPTLGPEEQGAQATGTFFVDPEIYTALTFPTVAYEQQTRRARVAFFVDPVFASLDPAIRIAIVARAHAVPLAAKAVRTGKGKLRLEKFPRGYRGLP